MIKQIRTHASQSLGCCVLSHSLSLLLGGLEDVCGQKDMARILLV